MEVCHTLEDIRNLWEQFTSIFTHTFLQVELWRLVAAGVVMVIAFILRRFFVHLVIALFRKITRRAKTALDDALVKAIDPPARLLVIAIGFFIALALIRIPVTGQVFAGNVLRTVVAFAVFWALYRAADILAKFFEKIANRTRTPLDDVLVPYMSKGVKLIVVIIAISVIAKEWNYDLGALLTGLGLGGLAFALAAQETLANFFGGLTIMVDKPFQIGDWIQTPDIEGTVEDIGFRSTRIRTFAQALVTVPNAGLAKSNITNWSKMGKRRVDFSLSVNYDTKAEQLEELLVRARSMLVNHPEIHPETIYVNLDSFGKDGFVIIFYFFTKDTDRKKFLEVKEDVLLKLMHILDELGVKLAYPSMSVYMEKLPDNEKG